jgi:hypothetical protein
LEEEGKEWIPEEGIQVIPLQELGKGAQLGQPSRSVHQQNFPSQSRNKLAEK